jgi:hypothetical protein
MQEFLHPIETISLCCAVSNIWPPKLIINHPTVTPWTVDSVIQYTWSTIPTTETKLDLWNEPIDNQDSTGSLDWFLFFQRSWRRKKEEEEKQLIFDFPRFLYLMRGQTDSRPPGWIFLNCHSFQVGELFEPVKMFWHLLMGKRLYHSLHSCFMYWVSLEFRIPKVYFRDLIKERSLPRRRNCETPLPTSNFLFWLKCDDIDDGGTGLTLPLWLQWRRGLLSDHMLKLDRENVLEPLNLGYYEEALHFIRRGDVSLSSLRECLFEEVDEPVEAYQFLIEKIPALRIRANHIPKLNHPLTIYLLQTGALVFTDFEKDWFTDFEKDWYKFTIDDFEDLWIEQHDSSWFHRMDVSDVKCFLLQWIKLLRHVSPSYRVEYASTMWEQCHNCTYLQELFQSDWDGPSLVALSALVKITEARVLDSLASQDPSLFWGTLGMYLM